MDKNTGQKWLYTALLSLAVVFISLSMFPARAEAQEIDTIVLSDNNNALVWLQNSCNPNLYCIYGYTSSSTLPIGVYDFSSSYTSTQIGDIVLFTAPGTVSETVTPTDIGSGQFSFSATAPFSALGTRLNAGYSRFLNDSILLYNGTLPTSTPSSTTPVYATSTCEAPGNVYIDYVGDIRYGICSAMTYLFMPSPDQQTDLDGRFNSRWTDISTRVPFGYFSLATNAINTISSPTASSTDIIPVASIESIAFFGYLKTGLGDILILVFLMCIYYFGKNIDL